MRALYPPLPTNGFALFSGERAASSALSAAERVKRFAREVLLSSGGEFEPLEAARLKAGREVILIFSLGEGSGPTVHGYLEMGDEVEPGPRQPLRGEFSLLGRSVEERRGTRAGYYAARDALGTRGLYVAREGPARGSLASDYRLLPLGSDTRSFAPGFLYEREIPSRWMVKGGHEMREEGEDEEEGQGRKGGERSRVLGFDESATELAALLEDSVRRRIKGKHKVAVSFSGGLDSSILALVASRYTDVVLCSAYAKGSRDEFQAERAAALLGLRLETVVLEEDAVSERAREAELPPGLQATMMDRALWCIYSLTSEAAAKKGARMILLGQLADELFGGYRKYAVRAREGGVPAAEKMMRDDVKGGAERGFARDEAACSSCCEVRFPFADERIASLATRLPFDFKITSDGERKAILRAAALALGLPEELAAAPKKAAQFSSGAAKLLKRA